MIINILGIVTSIVIWFGVAYMCYKVKSIWDYIIFMDSIEK
jgi:hypothetical protein